MCVLLGPGGSSWVLSLPQNHVPCQTAVFNSSPSSPCCLKSVHSVSFAFEVLCKHLSMVYEALLRTYLGGSHKDLSWWLGEWVAC